ncbi:hypothetical protein D9M68_932620 [compost metagenome]
MDCEREIDAPLAWHVACFIDPPFALHAFAIEGLDITVIQIVRRVLQVLIGMTDRDLVDVRIVGRGDSHHLRHRSAGIEFADRGEQQTLLIERQPVGGHYQVVALADS